MTLSPKAFALCMPYQAGRQWVRSMSSGQHTLIIGVIAAVALHASLLWFWPQPAASLPSESTTAIFIVDAVAATASQPAQEVVPEPDVVPEHETVPEQIAEQSVPVAKVKKRSTQQKETLQEQTTVAAAVEAPLPASVPAAAVSTEPVFVDKPQFVSPPVYPAYPSLAHRRGQQGTVWLEIWLSESGKQIRLSIARSSGFAVLDEAAKTAAESWKFLPYRLNGMTVASRVQVPVEFVIQ